ncbi:U3 small nucleolar RNA-associated protein 14 homolog A [Hypomesus transpacificus]|uniref:U3 small nucleolar RNA-associated protein 14 homolog A n=1 Tax=Hypomesus transpacificus TaxID=137520 RepID=UPI001F075D46|nr:U3 small nucleolar RNA-associated protein 14 homolog A [Hypomesus transpacificus]
MESDGAMIKQGMCDDHVENQADPTCISASEDEDGSDDERKNRKLLEAISSLGGKKRKKLAERSEACIQVSEFTVNAEGEGEKINLSDLIGTMDKTTASLSKTKKQLRNLQNSHTTLETPLSKQETQKIHRDVAFDKTAKEVSRWESIVKQNRRAEQLVFPLNQEPSGPKRMDQVVTGWKAQTPLEQEIFSLLHKNKQPIHHPVLTPMEEASLGAMSLEEAKVRRAELQKARVLQSYYEAKAKRERKIKSKKYHRVQNKAKRKEFLKQFDDMLKTDPAAALEELKKMELSRMQERMSLKHQNSGKWAKSKAIMAKYDEGARKAMQSQLEVNKDLTQKVVVVSEEEDEDKDSPDTLPDFVNDSQSSLDPVNPWMRGKLSVEPTVQEAGEGTEVPLLTPEETAHSDSKAESEQEVEETEEEVLLRDFETRRKLRRTEVADGVTASLEDKETPEENKAEQEVVEISDSEEEDLSEFTSLYQGIANSQQKSQSQEAQPEPIPGPGAVPTEEAPGLLEETLVRIRTLEDVEMLSQNPLDIEGDQPLPPVDQSPNIEETALPCGTQKAGKKMKRKRGIDPNEVLTKEAKMIKVPLVPTAVEDENGEEEQRTIISEAFAGDDVVSDFLKDKRKQEEAGKPKVVDLTLPGWGEWGGQGLKTSRRKQRRFRVKAAPPPPRRDGKLRAIIISEKRDSAVAALQVSQLPFPFENPAQFQHTIRSPIGRTWNTQQVVRKITAPKVVTQLGAIIDPIAREELMKGQKQMIARTGPNIPLESIKDGVSKTSQKRTQKKKKRTKN